MSPFEKLKEEYLTEPELAELLGVKVNTLQNRRSKNFDHPPYVKVNNRILYPVEPFKKWLKDKEVRQVNRAS